MDELAGSLLTWAVACMLVFAAYHVGSSAKTLGVMCEKIIKDIEDNPGPPQHQCQCQCQWCKSGSREWQRMDEDASTDSSDHSAEPED